MRLLIRFLNRLLLNERMSNLRKIIEDFCGLYESIAENKLEIDYEGRFRRRGFIDPNCEKTVDDFYSSLKNKPLQTLAFAMGYYFSDPLRILKVAKTTASLAIKEVDYSLRELLR